MLPYCRLPDEVVETAKTLAEFGATVARPQEGKPPWPRFEGRMDNAFLEPLFKAICANLDARFPVQVVVDEKQQVAFEILRGLASHKKLGPNNHSHKDDLWKTRGRKLGPGGKEEIEDWLRAEGILASKGNISAGGTGEVFWIADVAKAQAMFPGLAPYFSQPGDEPKSLRDASDDDDPVPSSA
jgi:hypothetical protein